MVIEKRNKSFFLISDEPERLHEDPKGVAGSIQDQEREEAGRNHQPAPTSLLQ